MFVTELGMVMEDIKHPRKAPVPMLVTELSLTVLGIVMEPSM